MLIHELETPALIVDRNILKQNIQAMKNLLNGSGLSLRPHYKSHKCASIAHCQIENGAIGMTCAKLSEAEDLVDSGIEDVLIANQIVDPHKIRRVAELAGKCRLTICVDNEENIRNLADAASFTGNTVHCLIEYEIGMQRCGVIEPTEVLRLARLIREQSHLTFDGIQAYAGHLSHTVNDVERREKTEENAQKLRSLLTLLCENGIEVNTVSGGSTGTAEIKAAEGLYTELQAGSYLFMDATYSLLGLPFKNALFVLSTIVSSRDGFAVVDSGVKTCGVDQGMPIPVGFEVFEVVASEEHFQLHGVSEPLKTGEKIRLIPAHCCSTVNLHDRIYVVDDDRVINRIPITARGCGK